MKKYRISIANQAHESIRNIVRHKIEYSGDISWAISFSDGFYDELEQLEVLPYRGTALSLWCRVRTYRDHLIVYTIVEPDTVEVIDLVDPRQHTVAWKYYTGA